MKQTLTLLITVNCAVAGADEFASDIPHSVDRVWVGPNYWANRLHDWRIANGRIECMAAQPRLKMRTLQLLTHRLGSEPGGFSLRVRLGLLNERSGSTSSDSTAGFLVGVGNGEMDYRAAAVVHRHAGRGGGYFFGVNSQGQVVVMNNQKPEAPRVMAELEGEFDLNNGLILEFGGAPDDEGKYTVNLRVSNAEGTVAADVFWSNTDLKGMFFSDLTGGLALVSHPGTRRQDKSLGRWWFDDWEVSGERVVADSSRTLGPIVSTQYTLSRNVMKLTAQFTPIGDSENSRVELHDGADETIATAEIERPGYTATFRVEDWDSTTDTEYTVSYDSGSADSEPYTYSGTIRRDPVDKETIVVAGFTGNHNNAHGFSGNSKAYHFVDSMWFPHADVTGHVAKHKPDLLFFSGDQVYEGNSPTFPDSHPDRIKLDYLYKWYLWCWAYRDLTRDIPSICMPDDHDVFQGNIWGQGGRKSPGRDHHGGYVHPADFVQMVDRTQTSHLPDPYSSEPIEQGIGTYFTDLVWGRIGVAVLEDRKFKSGCARDDMPPSGTGRPDHFNDPEFDVASLDIPGVKLLGEKQLEFLHGFAAEWKGQDMKLAVSQTIFANMATHHGGRLMRLIADLDSNGWPQSGRNRAVDALRRGFVFHLGGDQHLATIVHHGIEEHGDAMWSFCVPSVANFYPRAWAPKLPGEYSLPSVEDYTGPHRDGFGHPVVVYAATNPGADMGREPQRLHDNMPGYGIVRFNKSDRSITMECWPRFSDPDDPDALQYTGWPKTISMFDNYARKPTRHLSTVKVTGIADPVVQVIDESTDEIVYTVRINGTEFRPRVFSDGPFRIVVSDTQSGESRQIGAQLASDEVLQIDF